MHEVKLIEIQQVVIDETAKMINIIEDKTKLINECERTLAEINTSLDSVVYEDNVLFKIPESRTAIENNELNKDQLKQMRKEIEKPEIEIKLNELLIKIKNFEKNFKFIPNQVPKDDVFLNGQIETVKILEYFRFIFRFFNNFFLCLVNEIIKKT